MKSQVIYEQSSIAIMFRLKGLLSNLPLTPDDVSEVKVNVCRASGELVKSHTFTGADVMKVSLQTDNRWTDDEIGYNGFIPLDQTYFPSADNYLAEILVTNNDGFNASFAVSIFAKNLVSV